MWCGTHMLRMFIVILSHQEILFYAARFESFPFFLTVRWKQRMKSEQPFIIEMDHIVD